MRNRAIGLLARRERTRAELRRRLIPIATTAAQVDELLDDLTASGLLSDERFAEGRVRSLARRYGATRVRSELERAGLSESLVDQAMDGLDGSELARARAIWTRRFDAPPGNALERARQYRFLHARGFSFDIIRRVIREADHE